MGDSFLNNFSTLQTGVNIKNQPFSKTIPSTNCVNGIPISKYSGTGVNTFEVVYSTWCNYQNTMGAKFTTQQLEARAPATPTLRPGPANIFIMRPAEKNTGSACGLNNNGIYRACQIVDFVNFLASQGYPISYIITVNPCGFITTNPSIRSSQTVSMASFMLNIPYFVFGGSDDTNLAAEALYNGTFDGLNVLMCFKHASIQQLILEIANQACAQEGCTSQNTADQFFVENNACLDGNYLDTEQGEIYSPPTPSANGDYTNSQNYPYWNDKNFDFVYWFNSSTENPNFTFNIFQQTCSTCYASCNRQICLYQAQNPSCSSSQTYYNKTTTGNIEDMCELPTNWIYLPTIV